MNNEPTKGELERLYHGEKLTQVEIGDRFGVGQPTVSKWMSELGVGTRSNSLQVSMAKPGVGFGTKKDGYEKVRVSDGGRDPIAYIHRLVAAAEYGFDAIEGMHVHHTNGIPWDNRPGNLQVVTNSEHGQLHGHDNKVKS